MPEQIIAAEQDFGEDYDFDIYKDESEEEETIETVTHRKLARVTGLRSRFSNGEAELIRLAKLGDLMTKYSIEVETGSQDINTLKRFFGVLNEFWESIRNVVGSVVQDEITYVKNQCRELLIKHRSGTIPDKVHNNLLYYRKNLYYLRQSLNLGYEVEKSKRGYYSRAKKAIVQ